MTELQVNGVFVAQGILRNNSNKINREKIQNFETHFEE